MTIAQNYPNLKPSLSLDFASVKALDPRVTFARASGAVYYDGQTVAKAEENLLQFSQEFDNGYWTKSNLTVIANNTTAPDGTTTAELIHPASTGANRFLFRSLALPAIDHMRSIFAKAQNKSIFYIDATGTGTIIAYFDLSAGTVGTVPAGFTASITDVGNGWYRCSLIKDVPATFSFGLVCGVADADGSTTVTANGTDGLFIWGAQLEQRSAVTAYTPTTTQPITRFQPVLESEPANVARFDHNPVTGQSLGLLVEEQRTNLLTRSEEFDNAGWTKLNATVMANQVIAPDGTLTMDKLISNSGSVGQIRQVISLGVVTVSIFAKAAEFEGIRFGALGNGGIATFNLSTGLVTSTSGTTSSASMVNVGNGIYRCVATWNQTANNTLAFDHFSFGTGDGFSGIYIWGAQLEAGAFPTSYIKTVASQVTRAADSASMVGANFSEWYRQDEGSFYVEMRRLAANSNMSYRVGSGNLNVTSSVGLSLISNGNASFSSSGGILIAFGSSGADIKKTAGSYKTNDNAVSVNGLLIGTDTSSSYVFADTILLGGAFPLAANCGYFKKLSFYSQRLTNEQLQALTS